jgi:drug/metabolite transporter (DMT)-like permease
MKNKLQQPIVIAFLAIIAAFLWGSAAPLVKRSYQELHIGSSELFEQLVFAGYRFVLAALLLLLLLVVTRRKITFRRTSLRTLFVVGGVQTFLQYVCYYSGVGMSTGMKASVISGTTSFFQMLAAHFMYADDRFTWRKTAGLLFGFGGVALLTVGRGETDFAVGIGEMLLLGAAFFGGLGNVLTKRASETYDTLYVTCFQMLFGGIGLLAVGAAGAGITPFEWNALSGTLMLCLSALSAFAFYIWNSLMQVNQVGKISMYLLFIPVFGIALSGWILGEKLEADIALAFLLIAVGIYVVNRRNGKRAGSDR